MEDDAPAPAAPKSLQDLAMDGHRFLESTVEAAHQTLSSMNEVLCNPALWLTPPPSAPSSSSIIAGSASASAADSVGDTLVSKVEANRSTAASEQEAGWAALDEARLRLRSSTTSLRSVISAIFDSTQIRGTEDPSNVPVSDAAEVEKLEQRVLELREDVIKKNKAMKVLIDQLREFISDVSMWQASNN